ncbi:MAG: cation:proton antiporter [Jatrophihabitantaceae bacterium]
MDQARHFALIVLLTAAVGLVAVLSNRLTERLKVPVPVLVLVAAATAVKIVPSLHAPPARTVEDILTVALVVILFDGGMHIGAGRFRAAAAPIALVGVLGTFLTAAGGAALLHYAFGLDWFVALLVATAVAPTDPAVVFSVLGQREIAGRSATVLEGESGANDPVGIALMSSLIAAGGLSAHAFGEVGVQFLLQMVVGGLIGLVGGQALLWFMRHVSLPGEGLYALRTLACAAVLFGVATIAHGSGFLAVFVAGIVIGDERAPYKREIERFHSALASLAEIVAFVVLGLTVDLGVISRANVLVPGLVLAVVVAFVVRPVFVGLCLLPARLRRNETAFILFAGLKGAVPLLLGELMLASGVDDAERLYGIVAVVVVFSVLVQGSLTPTAAHVLNVPMRPVEPEPWALGVRLRDEPQGVHRFVVRRGAPADGRTIADLDELPEDSWISFIVRDSGLVVIRGSTELEAGDQVLVLGDENCAEQLQHVFEGELAN